jgi:hypothetical protein
MDVSGCNDDKSCIFDCKYFDIVNLSVAWVPLPVSCLLRACFDPIRYQKVSNTGSWVIIFPELINHQKE